MLRFADSTREPNLGSPGARLIVMIYDWLAQLSGARLGYEVVLELWVLELAGSRCKGSGHVRDLGKGWYSRFRMQGFTRKA